MHFLGSKTMEPNCQHMTEVGPVIVLVSTDSGNDTLRLPDPDRDAGGHGHGVARQLVA